MEKLYLKSLVTSKKTVKTVCIILGMIILFMLFNIWTNNVFSSVRNLTLLMKQGSVLMIVSCGLMLLLLERNFDLSGGAAVYLVSVVVSQLVVTFGVNLYLSLFLGLLAGLLMGTLNGLFIGYVGIPAFIGTLAAQLIFRGIGYTWTDAATIGPIPDQFAWLSEGYLPKSITTLVICISILAAISFSILDYKRLKQWYGGMIKLVTRIIAISLSGGILLWIFNGYFGIPMCVFFAAVMVFITSFITNKTVFGRHIYIIGGNPEAAKISGINNKQRIFQSYLYMGIVYGVAGIVITARLGGSTATTGNLIELDAVAAACIGGTSMGGGVGRVSGVLLGVVILAGIDNVMSLMNVSSYLQMLVKGVILLFAVSMDTYSSQTRFKIKKTKR